MERNHSRESPREGAASLSQIIMVLQKAESHLRLRITLFGLLLNCDALAALGTAALQDLTSIL